MIRETKNQIGVALKHIFCQNNLQLQVYVVFFGGGGGGGGWGVMPHVFPCQSGLFVRGRDKNLTRYVEAEFLFWP